MEIIPLFLVVCSAIVTTAVTVSYFLVPAKIIAQKNEYVKFALVPPSAFLVLFSIVYVILFNKLAADLIFALFVLCLFSLLFLARVIYKFKTVKKNRHVGFSLFRAALASLPLAFGVFYGIFV